NRLDVQLVRYLTIRWTNVQRKLYNVKTQRQVVSDLPIGSKSRVVYMHVQIATTKKMDNRHTKSSGKKIVTSNPFDVLNVFDKDIGVTSSDSYYVEDDDNETASFMASKNCKGKDSSKSGGGTGKKSLYECWRDDYNSNPYYYDEECEDLIEDQLAFRDAFDISLRGQIRR
ncbi:hypothetical protein Tco_1281729, partial [Tanacetum coccineum]